MGSRSSSFKLPFTVLSILFSLILIFLSQTDVGNWLKKSDYAQWSQLIEAEMTAQNADVVLVDFGKAPDGDDEFFVVVEIVEPQHEYEFERLFADLQRIIVETYMQTDPAPQQPDTIAVIVDMEAGMRMGVIAPFTSAMGYFQSGLTYEAWLDTWEFGFGIAEDLEVEE
jgi:hypothetical protein